MAARSAVILVSRTAVSVLTAEHRLVELWTKRAFTCDCPTSAMCPPSSPSTGKRTCKLNPPEQQPQPPNEANVGRYSHNFSGEFCRCGRDYDPETESEAMINCIGCEVSPGERATARKERNEVRERRTERGRE